MKTLNQKPVTGLADAIGNTPLIRMSRLSEMTGCDILGKAEFLNPGGSVKDRAALWMIRGHEKSGALGPGGTVVEGTAGNTGIGIAHVCNARGYHCIIYMPDNQSPEKVELLRTLGAEVRLVPAVPYRDEKTIRNRPAASRRLCRVLYGRISSITQPIVRPTTNPPARKSGRKRRAAWMHLWPPPAPAAPWPG